MSRLVGLVLALASMVGSARAEDGEVVVGAIVSVLPQGSKSVLVINRGSKFGVRVGQVTTCLGPPEFRCKVTEVYELRSKCVVDIDSSHLNVHGRCHFRLPERTRAYAKVLEVVAEEEGTTVVFNKGHQHGVGLSDWAEVSSKRCHIWRLEETRSACWLDTSVAPTWLTVVSRLERPKDVLTEPVFAPSPRLVSTATPSPRVRARALAPSIMRARGQGLVTAEDCLGFTPDEATAVVVSPSSSGVKPHADERGLVLERIDLTTGHTRIVATFYPHRVREARTTLAEIIRSEGLLACHAAQEVERTEKGTKGLRALHGDDDIVFWTERAFGQGETEDLADEELRQTVYASMEGGKGVAERLGPISGRLTSLWYLPGSPHHLVRSSAGWVTLSVGRP